MAFELPDHLPKGGLPRDKATQILNKLGQTSFKELNANLVASWVNELNDAITETKTSIADRIQKDLPEFDRLYQSSIGVQKRLHGITSTANELETSFESPTTGTLPKLIETLTLYSTRERLALETEVTYHAFEQLLQLCLELQRLHSHMDRGELPESIQVCRDLDSSILTASVPLQNANIMLDIKKRYRTLRDHVQEQLSNAYDRCISFSDETKLQIRQWTIVSPTSTQISFPAVLSSLSQDTLASKLTSFRRDILSKLVDAILLSSHTISVSEVHPSAIFSVVLSSGPTSSSPVQSLRSLSQFLRSHLFLHLPESQSDFAETLYTSFGSSLLTKLLQPSIPSSLLAVPAYLSTLNDAIDFENEYITAHSTSTARRKRHIQDWGDEIATHYEKKRREMFLEKARAVITSLNDGATFRVEMIVPPRTVSLSPLSASIASVSLPSPTLPAEEDNDEDNWGFNDQVETNGADHESKAAPMEHPIDSSVSKDDEMGDISADDHWGWGDDDTIEETEIETVVGRHEESQPENTKAAQGLPTDNDEENLDPWDDDPWAAPEDEQPPEIVVESQPKPPPPTAPPPITIVSATPKAAKRLEKFTAKSKGQTHSGASTPAPSPAISDAPRFPAVQPQTSVSTTPKNGTAKSPPQPLAKEEVPVRESYLVAVQARRILEITEEALKEGKEMIYTNVFSNAYPQTEKGKLGQVLLSTTSSVIDLYRALYPVSQSSLLSKDSVQYMQWSNDCLFLSKEMSNFKFPGSSNSTFGDEKWLEAQERTRILGECCFEDAISKTQEVVYTLLTEANGFFNVSESDQYEKCKDIIFKIIDELENTAQKWKKILSKSEYLIAAGRIVEDTLYRFMDEIISLEDIPQKDSEYISEFCEMMERLEGLFIYAPGEESVVGACVPIWFKFAYFSWLIKGSLADISYMFDQGHLIDYEIDELVRLLRALFADTPLRENTIQKILKGHPANTEPT